MRGLARLQFALVVIVAGVIATLALERLASLQVQGKEAQAQTLAAQQRAASALAQARCMTGSASTPPRSSCP